VREVQVNSRFFAFVTAAVLLPLPLAGQTASTTSTPAKPAAPAARWTPPRTPDGQPDLQGMWTNATYTPLQRPVELGTKAFYTEQELAQIEKRRLAQAAQSTAPGTTADVHYDFDQYGLDRSQGVVVPNTRTSLVVDPPDGRIPPVTPEGQRRAAARAEARRQMGGPFDGPENRGLPERCIIWNAGPPILPIGYNSDYQIVQNADYVMILTEMIHDVRIVPLDGRPPLPQGLRQLMGSSRGHWEGNTLVVETTHFTDRNPFQGSSENMRVTERFTRTASDMLKYEFTVNDPDTWAIPWSAEIPMKSIAGPIFEYACHEGNYGLANNLSGARAAEKAAEEAARQGSKGQK
jgi:hypothetical protein